MGIISLLRQGPHLMPSLVKSWFFAGSNLSAAKEADIVSKVKDGYIIKRWEILFYLKDAQHTVNALDRRAQQQKRGAKEGETGSVQASSSHKAGKPVTSVNLVKR